MTGSPTPAGSAEDPPMGLGKLAYTLRGSSLRQPSSYFRMSADVLHGDGCTNLRFRRGRGMVISLSYVTTVRINQCVIDAFGGRGTRDIFEVLRSPEETQQFLCAPHLHEDHASFHKRFESCESSKTDGGWGLFLSRA